MDKVEFTDPVVDTVSFERTFINVLAEEMNKAKQAAWEDFHEAHAEWTRVQEEMASKYTWIPAREIWHNTVICEQQGRGRRVLKYTVTDILAPESRFDRKIRLQVNKTKLWVYDPDDMVMVRRHA